MPYVSQTYGSPDRLEASLFEPGKTYGLTIAVCEEVRFDDGVKLKLTFRETERSLVLNRCNATAIADMLGDNTDHWIGRRIGVYRTTTQFGGKTVPCIRICPAPAGMQSQPQSGPSPAAHQVMTGQELEQQQQHSTPPAEPQRQTQTDLPLPGEPDLPF